MKCKALNEERTAEAEREKGMETSGETERVFVAFACFVLYNKSDTG